MLQGTTLTEYRTVEEVKEISCVKFTELHLKRHTRVLFYNYTIVLLYKQLNDTEICSRMKTEKNIKYLINEDV